MYTLGTEGCVSEDQEDGACTCLISIYIKRLSKSKEMYVYTSRNVTYCGMIKQQSTEQFNFNSLA
jgi:hypothetical protein